MFSFFDSLVKNNDIFRELPTDEIVDTKEDRYTSLYNLLSKIYKKYQISNVDLRPNITLYLNNLNEKAISKFRYNLSDIISYSEDSIINEMEYNENKKFKELYYNVIRSFRYLVLFIDERKANKLRKNLIRLETLSNEIKKSHVELENNASQLYKVIEKIEKTANSILPQTITVLGIFIGVLVVYLGAEELIGTFNRLFSDTPHFFFISLITIAHVLFNLTFFLLFLVSRISKSSVNIRCTKFVDIDSDKTKEEQKNRNIDVINESLKELLVDRRICANCAYANVENSNKKGYFGTVKDENGNTINKTVGLEEQCGQFDKFLHKYSYILFINLFFLFAELIYLLWWICRKKLFAAYVFEVSNPYLSSLCILGIIILSICILFKLICNIGRINNNSNMKSSSKYKKKNNLLKLTIIILILIVLLILILFFFGFNIVPLEE